MCSSLWILFLTLKSSLLLWAWNWPRIDLRLVLWILLSLHWIRGNWLIGVFFMIDLIRKAVAEGYFALEA